MSWELCCAQTQAIDKEVQASRKGSEKRKKEICLYRFGPGKGKGILWLSLVYLCAQKVKETRVIPRENCLRPSSGT